MGIKRGISVSYWSISEMLIYILVRCLPQSKTKMQDQLFLHDFTWFHEKFEKIRVKSEIRTRNIFKELIKLVLGLREKLSSYLRNNGLK